MFNSTNPILKSQAFRNRSSSTGLMTLDGVMNKCYFLFALMVVAAFFTWNMVSSGQLAQAVPLIALGSIGGFVLYFVMLFKPDLAKYIAPAYSVGQGLFLGGVSALAELQYPGLVLQAVGLTFGVFFMILSLYRSRIIQVTERFKMIMGSAIGGIFLVYVLGFVLSFFGVQMAFFGNGVIGIGFSLIVVGVAAFSLMLNFQQIEDIQKNGGTENMEWFASFGLLVSLVWLYLEILRLLIKLRGRQR